MREGRPSLTAQIVWISRGVAGLDPFAPELARKLAPFERALNVASLGLVDHVALRTLAIDEAVRDAPLEQVVILGAGLDARAHRMPELARAITFEVDHPSTQAFKRRRVSASERVHFVAVDFEKDSLNVLLERAGHRKDTRTFWIWEGVTPYLERTAIAGTLDVVAARSAPGSRIALTYGTPEGSSLGPGFKRLAAVVFRSLGEPLRGLMQKDTLESELASRGFSLLADTAPEDWARFFRPNADKSRSVIKERLAVAEKK